MAENKVEVEIVRVVYYDRVALTLRDCPENPDYIELCTISEKDREYWGKVNIGMPPELARKLGQALIDQAEDKERNA